jgi:hypothetical protein
MQTTGLPDGASCDQSWYVSPGTIDQYASSIGRGEITADGFYCVGQEEIEYYHVDFDCLFFRFYCSSFIG